MKKFLLIVSILISGCSSSHSVKIAKDASVDASVSPVDAQIDDQ